MRLLTGRAVIHSLARCLLPLALGGGAACMLLLALGGPIGRARAAPDSLNYPGCAPTLQACLDNAQAGETIVVQPGTYITSLTLSRAVSLTGVNSATVVLKALSGQRVLTVTGAAIDSSVVISGLTFTGGNASASLFDCAASCGGGLLITGTAQPRLENLRFVSNTAAAAGGGLYVDGGVALANLVFVSNTALTGGGLAAMGPTAIQGGLFQQNSANAGGGLWVRDTLVISGTSFVSNTALAFGGGAAAVEAITLHGGQFLGNRCLSVECYGGGTYAYSTLSLTATQFISNSASQAGGGVYAERAVTLVGGLFQGNVCTRLGLCMAGGLFANNQLTVTGTQFVANMAQTTGGGAVAAGTVSVQGGLFQSNRCLHLNCRGGGLHTGLAYLTGTAFISNTATTQGGGVYAVEAVTVSDGLFHGNMAGGEGGGLFAFREMAVEGTEFIANTAGEGAGLAHVPIGSPAGLVLNTLFARNAASGASAAMLLGSPGHVAILHTTIASPTLASDAAIVVLDGTVGITNSVIASHTVGISLTSGAAWESHNLFFGNSSDVAGGVSAGGGSQSGDPLFRNPAAGDYHLRSNSPARELGVDAGVTTDVDDDPRPQSGGFDAGYDEYPDLLLKVYVPFIRR